MLSEEHKATAIEALIYYRSEAIINRDADPQTADTEIAAITQAIAALESDTQYELVPDGIYGAIEIGNNGKVVAIGGDGFNYEKDGVSWIDADLPDNMRLCIVKEKVAR